MDQKKSILLFLGLVSVALISRFVPHPPNFSPLLAVALFAGAKLSSKNLAFLLPLGAIFISDLFLGFYPLVLGVYACLALIVFIGLKLARLNQTSWKNKFLVISGSSLLSSLVFYLTSNFLVWAFSGMYPLTGSGLMSSYGLALPFFHNTLLSTLLYSGALWGAYEWLSSRVVKEEVI